jgi:hypothetical protein
VRRSKSRKGSKRMSMGGLLSVQVGTCHRCLDVELGREPVQAEVRLAQAAVSYTH